MKIIIDIPEEIYDTIMDDQMLSREQLAILQHHIYYGQPLPKRHGRLIDADAMAKDLEYDCELDAIGLDDMNIVGQAREYLQFDKDCRQNCMWYLTEQETIVPAEADKETEHGKEIQ